MNQDQANRWAERVAVLENKLALAEEAGRELSGNYIKRGERLDKAIEQVAELERVLGVARDALVSVRPFGEVGTKFRDAIDRLEI